MRRNWMPLYIPDFIADTTRLSAAETGAYLCLIMDYWLHDGLPDDDEKLAAIARLPLKSWRQMRPTIQVFFRDGWRHKRIDAELTKMITSSHRRQAAGSKGGTVSSIRRSNASSNASSKKAAIVQHTTQERYITTTTSAAARAEETPTNSTIEPAEPPAGSAEKPLKRPSELTREELAEIYAKKRATT